MSTTANQFIAAYGFIKNKDNHFLLVQRAKHDTFPGMWELPGGAVENNENLTEATKREVLEETGLHVTVGQELAMTEGTSRHGKPIRRHAFLCTFDQEKETLKLSDEHSAFQWISTTDHLPEYLSELVREIFARKEELGL